MNRYWLRQLVLCVAVALACVGVVQAGGWAVLTLDNLPQNVMMGESFVVRFSVRQHGNHLISGIDSLVTAVHPATGETLAFKAQAAEKPGYYEAVIMLPMAGWWNWQIKALGTHTMPPMAVLDTAATFDAANLNASAAFQGTLLTPVAPWQMVGMVVLGSGVVLLVVGWRRSSRLLQTTAVVVMGVGLMMGAAFLNKSAETAVAQQAMYATDAELGAALFVAKGCISCHTNNHITYARSTVEIGPNLTNYQGDPEFMRQWLRDPAQIRPQTAMPDLGLADGEIAALIAFLNEDKPR